MKRKRIIKRHLITFLLLGVLLFVSCFRPNDEIISDGTQRLVIDNAFYINDLFSCIIQFDYYVTEDTCNVGGWGIDFQDGGVSSINWYIMQKCIPSVRYTIHHISKRKATLPPIIGMQGYKLDDCETYPELIARDTLQIRTS
ncbi:MAG: hypothetical protein U9O95_08595 [Candidatus Marinimicrobia bacterium]|nr:hypothetical protein [Candidatus Neomarinimicrobiota bacterium]